MYPTTQLIYEPSLIKVSENVFALAYNGQNNDGYVTIINISSNGTIVLTNETEVFEQLIALIPVLFMLLMIPILSLIQQQIILDTP